MTTKFLIRVTECVMASIKIPVRMGSYQSFHKRSSRLVGDGGELPLGTYVLRSQHSTWAQTNLFQFCFFILNGREETPYLPSWLIRGIKLK